MIQFIFSILVDIVVGCVVLVVGSIALVSLVLALHNDPI